ncbi:MAG: nucleoid DNA-binding protein [Paraglaciecola sp.]
MDIKPVGVKRNEIIEMIKKEKPKLLGKIPEKKVAAIIRASLQQLAAQVDALDEGVIKVPGFGKLRIKQVEREMNGVKEKIKRVIFIPTQKSQSDAVAD